jgi:hypothetical protein
MWHHEAAPLSSDLFRLLIRGFGVQVPGGAPVLTWALVPAARAQRRLCSPSCSRRPQTGPHAVPMTAPGH